MKAIELTEAEAKEFELLVEANDKAGMAAFLASKVSGEKNVTFDWSDLYAQMLPDIFQCAHYCMHVGREKDMKLLLCTGDALLNGHELPTKALVGFVMWLREIMAAREFHDRERGMHEDDCERR